MKLKHLVLLSLILLSNKLAAIEAAITYAAFQSPEQAYVELYWRIAGSGISFVLQGDGLLQAKADISLEFLQGDKVALADRFRISSPLRAGAVDFIALERYPLPAGAYELRMQISDAANPENVRKYRASIDLTFTKDNFAQSDIHLLAAMHASGQEGLLVRNGIYMEPLPYRYYGPDTRRLLFYHEIYNTDKYIGRDFALTYAIESVQNGQSRRLLEMHRRQAPGAVLPLYGQLDISKLPSGFYLLAIEIRDAGRQLLSRKTAFFQRSNPDLWRQSDWTSALDPELTFVGKLEKDSLAYSLRALNPRLPQTDVEAVNYILKEKDQKAMQAYLLIYWSSQSPNDPEQAYREYMQLARAVDRQFHSGFRYGFETDRGYIYLRYGRPTEVEDRENEPSAPPYEIWTYDQLPATQQNNVRFVFYNPSLAPGDYLLLHSTARGELQQPQWQRILYKNAPGQMDGNDYLEGTEVIDNFHRSSRRIFGEN